MPKFDLSFSPAILNAPGSLGFAPHPYSQVDLSTLGAFVTNPISFAARTPARGARYLEFPGGFLLHSGHPNPGFKVALRRYAAGWARAPLPVVVHLLAQSAVELSRMVRRLEGLEGVAGVELGLAGDLDPPAATILVEAALGELPLVARLPLNAPLQRARRLVEAGAAAISLGAPRGSLVGPDGGLVEGRLMGQALFPLALAAVRHLVKADVPVIGGGGVYRREQAEAMLDAGAVAVQLDAILWRSGWG